MMKVFVVIFSSQDMLMMAEQVEGDLLKPKAGYLAYDAMNMFGVYVPGKLVGKLLPRSIRVVRRLL